MSSCPWQKAMSFYLKLVNPIVTGFLSWGPAGGTTYVLMPLAEGHELLSEAGEPHSDWVSIMGTSRRDHLQVPSG